MNNVTRKLPKLLVPVLAAALLCAGALTGTARAASKDAPAQPQAAPTSTGVVNLNTATEDELMLLPGVGPSKATAIVAWRKKHGGFKRIEDLTKVRGFGLKTFRKLKPHLAIKGPTTFRGKKSPVDDADMPRPTADSR